MLFRRYFCLNLRLTCFLIAYLNLIAVCVDIFCHVLVVSIVTNGFQCDVDKNSVMQVDWPWLEHMLVIINFGTHGFYPFPLAQTDQRMHLLEHLRSTTVTRCYPGMLHVCLIDVLNFLINVIWFNFVKSYLVAVHKKDHETMRMFFGVCIVKLVLQIMYFGYQPDFGSFWIIKLLDICMAAFSLITIYEYVKELRQESSMLTRRVDQPPSYIECLIAGPLPNKTIIAKPEANEERDKTEIEVITITNPTNLTAEGTSKP